MSNSYNIDIDEYMDDSFNPNFLEIDTKLHTMYGGGKYPIVDDPDFNNKINKAFSSYKIRNNSRANIDSFCGKRTFKLQKPQQFVAKYINPRTNYDSLLIYHRIGAGKTCSAIQIGETWKKKRTIHFVLPASLIGNFRNELRSKCTGNAYISDNDRKLLNELQPTDNRYIEIIDKSNKKIDKYYKIYSYNKFISLAKDDEIELKNSVLIIDEIQNMISSKGTYYYTLSNLLESSPSDLKIVLLSATPMFDKPTEFALTFNLLRPKRSMETGKKFINRYIKSTVRNGKVRYDVQNMDEFKELIKGYVSYYKGAPSFTFPHMTVRYVECEMSKFQYSIYKKILKSDQNRSSITIRDFDYDNYCVDDSDDDEYAMNVIDLPNNFYIGTRYVSNVVFPNKKINKTGAKSLTYKKIQNNLDKYSCKHAKMMISINRTKGKVFIYSGFKGYAGISVIAKVLRAYGYKDYAKYGTGKKRYAIWSGDVKLNMRDRIRDVYNKYDNLGGNKLRIIIGSPSIKEGVSLKAVRYVHVLEPYWNMSRLYQVFGRASRFCSHIDLEESDRNVKVYVYIAKGYGIRCGKTVDQYIRDIAIKKDKLIKKFEIAIRESAVDCNLNANANENDIDGITCDI
jgi:hypothetical protein